MPQYIPPSTTIKTKKTRGYETYNTVLVGVYRETKPIFINEYLYFSHKHINIYKT
jgi:hypothetical protein